MGDQINTILAAAGYNLRKLLRWIVFLPVLRVLNRLETLLNFKSTLQRRLLSLSSTGVSPRKLPRFG